MTSPDSLATFSGRRPPGSSLHIHILAVCGTGTASLAGCLAAQGHRVSGSDRNFHPPMGPLLQQAGVETRRGFDPRHLDPEPDLVVIGNAIHRDNPEALAAMERGIPFLSFPQAVRRFLLHGRHPVVVAGTHGKTSTTATTAWILEAAGLAPGFLVGGVLNNFQRSYGLGSGAPFAVEGDEYETAFFDKVPKFLHYAPQTLVLTGVEFDHADNFSGIEQLQSAFLNLTALLPHDGCLVFNAADPFLRRLARRFPGKRYGYGLHPTAEITATDVTPESRGMRFTLRTPDAGKIPALLSRWGRYNLDNALAAAAVALDFGADPDRVAGAMAGFQGVRRRQEVVGQAGGVTVIDDFAHHPTAVRLTLEAVAAAHPGRRVWAVFEPRSYTTQTRLFQDQFASSFGGAKMAILAPLPPATKVPLEDRLDRRQLAADLSAAGITACAPETKEEIPGIIAAGAREGDVVLVMSSGDFGGMPQLILELLAGD
jgi:UDP-N-acetylmuramate: L-alanyl-gamma-D-glutamyl-meso-diaminopimelate ligase